MRRSFKMLAAAAVAAMAVPALAATPANLISIVGQPLPGSGGLNVTGLNTAYVAGNGKVGFVGTLSDTARFVYFENQIIFRSTDVVGISLTGAEGTMGVGNLGEFAYSPSIDGADGIWTQVGKLARGTDPAPDMPGMFHTFGSRPRMTADGTAYWVGGITNVPGSSTTQQRVFWKGTTTGGPPALGAILVGGQAIAGETLTNTGIEFPYSVSDNNQHLINRVTFSGSTATDAAVVLNGTSVVAREGFPTHPGASFNWQGFRFVGVNNSGNWIVYGDDNGPTTSDDILVYNGDVVARQGNSLAGVTLGTTIDAAAINNLNQIIQIWDLTSGTDEGLFFGNANDVGSSILLLRTGDELDVTGNGVADYVLTDFNASATITDPLAFGDDGLVYLDVDLAPIGGGTAERAIISVVVPEPGAISILAIGAAGLLRRRR